MDAESRLAVIIDLMKKRDFETAEQRLNDALEHYPHHYQLLIKRARTRQVLDKYPLAIEDLNLALHISPYSADAYYLMLTHHIVSNQFKRAKDILEILM